eukprot:CAMPEP_0115362654 /NCGR_PEP_ID=MMETSP0270-20121206/102815_1 /TAXON_ID=71861 /ORGANISM="Scrippsiella trochoidea, Strain CCMP3099" /LENGTH=368 /DNA_ID=CAMNT_0002785229 /DNA_START=33 /DNA_END=1139 /DNA_ORIENTATION=-
MTASALPDGALAVGAWLALLFLSSMGEAYFPDLMNINGLQAKANWLFVADAIGNISGALVPTKESWKDVPASKAIVPALCDAVSKVFILGGIALSSAQVKSILYNSCIVFSALLSRFLLGRILSVGQWVGVAVLVIGLVIKLDLTSSSGDANPLIPLGMVSILIGCALHSLTNVVNEYYIRRYAFPPSKLCCLVGSSNLMLWLLLVASGFIIPEKEGSNPFGHTSRNYIDFGAFSNKSELTPMSNLWSWCGFVLSSAVHALAYYNLLGSIGVVSCGVMKGLTTAGYVTLSAVLLCDSGCDKLSGWCLTNRTVASSVCCVVGVLIYSFFSASVKEQGQKPADVDVEAASRKDQERESNAIEMGTPFANK